MPKHYLYPLLAVVLFACDRTELPVPPHGSGNLLEAEVAMGTDYRWQVYYDLESGQVVTQNQKTSWDLAFDAAATGFQVTLNSAKMMFAAIAADTSFDAVTDTAGFQQSRRWDASAGPEKGTAFGDWRTAKPVYLVDCGFNETGTHLGFVKVQLLQVDATGYDIRFARLNGGPTRQMRLVKDDRYNRIFLSFSSEQQLDVEPPKDRWDLVFTQYIHTFADQDSTPYLVTGCLLNGSGTAAYEDSMFTFDSWDFTAANALSWSSDLDVIGYDWKTFSGLTYLVNERLTYILRTRSGYLFKLRFVDFYSQTGVKGSPRWEYQRL